MINHEYETTYIVQPEALEPELTRLQEKFLGIIDARSGSLLVRDDMGRRKLAYPIGKHHYGIYVYLNYVGPADLVAELERNMRNEDPVVRFLTVRNGTNVDTEERRAIAIELQRKRAEMRAAQSEDDELEAEDVVDSGDVEPDVADED